METIKEFLDLIALRLTEGPIDDVAARHDYPFLLETGTGPARVFRTATEHMTYLAEQRTAIARRGVVRVVPDIVATDLPDNGRFRVWVRWRHLTADAQLAEEVASLLVLHSLTNGQLRVEMAQVLPKAARLRVAAAGQGGEDVLAPQDFGASPIEARYDPAVTIARPTPSSGRLGRGARMPASVEKPLQVTAFFERMGQLFSEGRLEELSDHWHFPSPVMIGSQIHLMRTRDDYLDFVSARREAGLAAGLISVAPLLAAVEIPRYGRLRVWMRWRATFRHGVVDDADGSVFYLSRSPQGALAVEMLESIPRHVIEATLATA